MADIVSQDLNKPKNHIEKMIGRQKGRYMYISESGGKENNGIHLNLIETIDW